MNALVVGSREDVAGFALAGVEGVVCTTIDDAARIIARADDETLVFVSAEFGQLVDASRLQVALPPRS